MESKTHNKGLLWMAGVVLLLLVAYGLRTWDLGRAELSFDEVATVFVARRSPLDVVRYVLSAAREHPPLYYTGMSVWFRLAGTEEFTVRYPSVLINLLAVAWGIRLGRKFLSREGGWWCGLLLALTPLSLWSAHNGRMYALVMLLGILTIEAWWRWVQDFPPRPAFHLGRGRQENPPLRNGRDVPRSKVPRRSRARSRAKGLGVGSRWLLFMVLSIAGMLTHYFLILLWVVEGAMLLLAPRRTRAIRWTWLGTVGAAAGALLAFTWISPGIRAMLKANLGLFPLQEIRVEQLRYVLTELYMAWPHHELFPAALGGLALSLLGWGLVWWRKDRAAGALLAAWGVLPIVTLNFVPVDLRARYLIMVYPALVLGLAATIALLRPHLLRLGLAALILWQTVLRWDHIYAQPDNAFSEQIAFLNVAACPGDALIMNGPWPHLLLYYYTPPDGLNVDLIPRYAPPGFKAEVDIPKLEALVAQHERLWTMYGAIRPADPRYAVSRWLAENTYAVHRFKQLVLYLPPPEKAMQPLVSDVAFGESLDLVQAEVDRTSVRTGDPIQVKLAWERHNVQDRLFLTLGLLDAEGDVWQRAEFNTGPVHQLDQENLPERWDDLRGLWVMPGIPPGTYTLGLRVDGDNITMPDVAKVHFSSPAQELYEMLASRGWFPLGTVTVAGARLEAGEGSRTLEKFPHRVYFPALRGTGQTCVPRLEDALSNWANVQATWGERLSLEGLEPWDLRAMQGYPLGFRLWWKARAVGGEFPAEPLQLRVRLQGKGTAEAGPFSLGPDFYPTTAWEAGDIVQQDVSLILPEDLPAGRYHVHVQVLTEDGAPLPVRGTRKALSAWERWRAWVPVAVEPLANPMKGNQRSSPLTSPQPDSVLARSTPEGEGNNTPLSLAAPPHVPSTPPPSGSPAQVGLLNPAALGGEGIGGAWADLFTVQVEAKERDYRPPLFRERIDVRFGDMLRLRGYRLGQQTVFAGDSVELIVYWQAIQKPDRLYAVFNHLRGPDNGMLWQQDSWPQGGIYTTDHWLEGEVVEERYTITVPEDTPPGTYPFYTGVYNPTTGERLPAMMPRGARYPNDEVIVFMLDVVERSEE